MQKTQKQQTDKQLLVNISATQPDNARTFTSEKLILFRKSQICPVV